MFTKPTAALTAAALLVSPLWAGSAVAGDRRDEQDAARQAMLDGRVMPLSVIKRRMERRMGDARWIGVRPPEKGIYRMQYLRPDGRVIWIDVDGKTGEIVGQTD